MLLDMHAIRGHYYDSVIFDNIYFDLAFKYMRLEGLLSSQRQHYLSAINDNEHLLQQLYFPDRKK